MAKKRKSKPRRDYGDDIIDVVKLGAVATIGVGTIGAVSKAFND